MSLTKRTVVLSGNRQNGYLTVVKIGTTIGIKISLQPTTEASITGIKIGDLPVLEIPMSSAVVERNFTLDFADDAPISAVVVANGQEVAYGGIKGRISVADIGKIPEEAIVDKPKVLVIEPEISEPESQPEAPQIADNAQHEKSEHGTPFDFFKAQTERNFYLGVADKVEELLTVYPHDEKLEAVLPDSRIAKVNYDENEYYVVGTLSDKGKVTHLVYGVRGVETLLPPKEVADVSQFLPLKGEDGGYWIILQDAETGETIKND